MQQHVHVSAPGKVILHGEHAVVYGKSALAASLNLRTELTITHHHHHSSQDTAASPFLSLILPDLQVAFRWLKSDIDTLRHSPATLVSPAAGATAPPSPVSASHEAAALLKEACARQCASSDTLETAGMAGASFLHLYLAIAAPHHTAGHLSVSVASKLPIGAGLGSSAAYAVCVSAALLCLTNHIGNEPETQTLPPSALQLVNAWAFEAEKIMHGSPSGVDNAVGTHGGILRFKQSVLTPLQNMAQLRILLVNTKVSRSTKALVGKVRENKETFPAIVNPLIDTVETISDMAVALLTALSSETEPSARRKIFSQLEFLIDVNNNIMKSVGVGHESLDRICLAASRHGFHGKLTGAGGGGCAIVLLSEGTSPDALAALQSDLTSNGFTSWETTIGGAGVCIHPGK